jgi:hypothetical protein
MLVKGTHDGGLGVVMTNDDTFGRVAGPPLGHAKYGVLDMACSEELSGSDEETRVEPAVILGAGFKPNGKPHVLVGPIRRLVMFGSLFEALRLFDKAAVGHQDHRPIMRLELHANVWAPKAIGAHLHPIHAARKQLCLNPVAG